MIVSFAFILIFAIVGNVQSQEECNDVCAKKFYFGEDFDACKDGCRLQVIFAFAAGGDVASTKSDCHDGCAKSYGNITRKDACITGCDSQSEMKRGKNVRVSISNDSPTFEVALSAMNKILPRISHSFSSFESSSGLANSWNDPFAQMHMRMQDEMARFHQIAQRLAKLQQSHNLVPAIVKDRPQGHHDLSLKGPVVGNRGRDGNLIVESIPVNFVAGDAHFSESNSEKFQMGEKEAKDASLISRLAARTRRLSLLSQWLVFAALFLCLVSMLSISVAIVKQIKTQRYQNIRNSRIAIRPTFAEPLPAKKVPLESLGSVADYPLVHDSPPPAYDQLSVKKDESASEDPKV